jgi:hypothetical protein
MFESDGNPLSRFVGLTFEGHNNVDYGFVHSAKIKFENRILHEYNTYRNIRGDGLRLGGSLQTQASSEMQFRNNLFINCRAGMHIQDPNYYNMIISDSDFYDNEVGIRMIYFACGSIRRCHFENSTSTDLDVCQLFIICTVIITWFIIAWRASIYWFSSHVHIHWIKCVLDARS